MGFIFDIQHLCVHDGPGIRTTVFLKGCPLRCQWCHNPESLIKTQQLQYLEDLCIHCSKCHKSVDLCPSTALRMIGSELDSRSILDILEKNKIFWGKDGGVTFSGGEATAQIDFLYDLLVGSKAREYHTCVDTCGYTTWSNIERIRPYVDAFLYDVKAFSSDIHIAGTGVDNKLIKENLMRLSQLHHKLYIRIPLINEYNATIAEVTAMAEWLATLEIEGVTLMPYHVLGKSKRKMLGMKEQLILTPPTEEQMNLFRLIFMENNVQLI